MNLRINVISASVVVGLLVCLFSGCNKRNTDYPWLKQNPLIHGSLSNSEELPELTLPTDVLIERLSHPEARIRKEAARLLGERGRAGIAGIPKLIDGLTDKDEGVRQAAARSLGLMGQDAFEAVPYLLKALGDPDESVRREAANSLGEISKQAFKATPELIKAVEERRKAAQDTIERLGKQTLETLEREKQNPENSSISGFIDYISKMLESFFQ